MPVLSLDAQLDSEHYSAPRRLALWSYSASELIELLLCVFLFHEKHIMLTEGVSGLIPLAGTLSARLGDALLVSDSHLFEAVNFLARGLHGLTIASTWTLMLLVLFSRYKKCRSCSGWLSCSVSSIKVVSRSVVSFLSSSASTRSFLI